VLQELQKVHPEGLIVADAHSGYGVYALDTQDEWKQGIGKVLQRYCSTTKKYEIPAPIRTYIQTVLTTVGAENYEDFELYPGSPLLTQTWLRENIDEQRCTDCYMQQVEGLNHPENFQPLDCYDPATLDFLMPPNSSHKHNVVLLDGCFINDEEYAQVQALLDKILDRNPYATVLVWIPFVQGHKFRWSFATRLRDMAQDKAKVGRYYANIVLKKTGLQGSAMLVCNPTPQFDDVVDPSTLHWLAHVLHQGKDEYTVEQIMKKKKKKKPLEESSS
jgi:23S rRNA A2030 N6-methylase RlmJ